MLIEEVKLTDFGVATLSSGLSKEDERSAALAARAQKGDYDDGSLYTFPFVYGNTLLIWLQNSFSSN